MANQSINQSISFIIRHVAHRK